MKYLGIDWGAKRVGIAISDELGMIAIPLETVETKNALSRIQEIADREMVGEIVVGDPGKNSSIYQEVQEFVGQISMTLFLPVHLQNESFSSVFADQYRDYKKPTARLTKKDTTKKKDESAAAIILQRFLEKQT